MAALEQAPLHQALVRVNARAWGIATGLILGLGLFVATNVLVVKGGVDVGSNLGRLGQVLPGYTVSFWGSVVGFVYAFVLGYALGRLLCPRRPLERRARPASLGKHVRINGRQWGLAIGLLCALLLFATTNALVLRGGPNPGDLLKHLALYLPGYTVSFDGSLVGAAYTFAIGYLLGRLIGVVYNRAVVRAEA